MSYIYYELDMITEDVVPFRTPGPIQLRVAVTPRVEIIYFLPKSVKFSKKGNMQER